MQIATLMAGFLLVAMGLLKLGSVTKFIPGPVIVGFTIGIGVIIWVGQWKDFFGLRPTSAGEHCLNKLECLLAAIPPRAMFAFKKTPITVEPRIQLNSVLRSIFYNRTAFTFPSLNGSFLSSLRCAKTR